jgi:hypothetical protein
MMKRHLVFALGIGFAAVASAEPAAPGATPDWHLNATIIEACSCPMFCQCYFNTKPANHSGHAEHQHGAGDAAHFCRANNVFKVNQGNYGDVKLDGAKFWAAMDLGGDFSKGEMDWAVVTFDKSMTQEQRDAVGVILGKLYPVKWKSFKVAEGVIDEWKFDKDSAVATLDGGKSGEVRLKRFPGMTDDPIVIKNLRYWGAPPHDGFVLMPNEVEAYRAGDKPFEYKDSNGFMITFDISSKDFPSEPASTAPSR